MDSLVSVLDGAGSILEESKETIVKVDGATQTGTDEKVDNKVDDNQATKEEEVPEIVTDKNENNPEDVGDQQPSTSNLRRFKFLSNFIKK